ncbi:MAG: hypothetical protein QM734_15385 [Cyclobacteriaceae bacterium]
MKSIAIAVIIHLSYALSVSAQNTPVVFDLKSMIPTSPEAAILGRFGEIPIGYYTGTPDISIPLYTIKEGGLEIPIALKYHASGIRVTDEATSVGLGWLLEPQPSILQIINGKKDWGQNGGDNLPYEPTDNGGYAFLKGRMTSSYNSFLSEGDALKPQTQCCTFVYAGCNSRVGGDSGPVLNGLLQGDGQPDTYQYNFMGYSGKFYIHPETGEIVFLDKKSHIIFQKPPYYPSNSIEWMATTLDGNKFLFETVESAQNLVQNYDVTSLKLSTIQLHNGKTIDFNYYSGYYNANTYSETYAEPYPFNLSQAPQGSITPYQIYYTNSTKTLANITSPEVIINFHLEDRIDLAYGNDNDGDDSNGTLSTKRIKSIDIISRVTNKKIKSFNFYYSYFPYNTIGSTSSGLSQEALDVLGKRLKLDSLTEIGYDPITGTPNYKPSYKFTYDQTILPLKNSFAKDFWGQYNGQDNKLLMPDFTYLYYSGHPEFQNFRTYYTPNS